MEFQNLLFTLLSLLAIVSICVALSKKLGLGSILGLLIAGVIVGPYFPGIQITDDVESLRHFAELGVVLLLFLIGLEMKPKKLWAIRNDVFGFGSLQILVSAFFIAGYAYIFMPNSFEVTILIGLTFALSSTAYVVQILQERGEIASRYGSSSFGVLLMQDLAIVPLLALVPLLSEGGISSNIPLWQQALFVTFMVGVVIVFGKYIVPYLLERFAKDRNKEAFAFMVLFSVVLAAWSMEFAGLSMALGAFLMGMTLSDSKYHFQIEAHIEPYKGILLSLFFVAVGMSLDLGIVAENPLMIAQHVFVIMFIKIVVLFFLAILFGHTRGNAFRISFLLSQSGEFGFVLFGAAKTFGVIGDEVFAVGIAVISISMLLTPFYVKLGEMFARKAPETGNHKKGEIPKSSAEQEVVIAGYGRVGQVVGDMLHGSQIPYTAYDTTHEIVAEARKKGKPVFYGDMSDFDFLGAINLGKAKLVVVTVDSTLSTTRIVSHIKSLHPNLKVYARAKDLRTCDLLMKYGANYVIPEAMEGSLRLGAESLIAIGFDKDSVDELIRGFRSNDYESLRRAEG
ncbi:MAG: cation:proton antiporter [Campylobacterales bacterium]